MTHYEVLGVAPGATQAEIRAAYHDQARHWHPDLHPDLHSGTSGGGSESARVRMSQINLAWSVLSHPDRRRAYDRLLAPRAATTTPGVDWQEAQWSDVDDHDWWAERERWVPDEEGVASRSNVLRAAPVLLMAVGCATGVLWLVLRLELVLVVSMVAWILGGVGLVIIPMLAMSDSKNSSLRP